MAVKYYRYPSDLEKLEEEYKNLEVLGDYANYKEDEYMNLPVIPDDIAKALDELYGREGGTLPLVVQYIDNKKDLNDAYVGVGEYWNGEFSAIKGNYYIATPEYGLFIVIVPKNLQEDLNFVLNFIEFDEDKDNDWLPETQEEFEAKLKDYGISSTDKYTKDTVEEILNLYNKRN